MENLQLYSTNILLGGNMKYDLVIENKDNELVVNNFHITPISEKLPYNVNLDDILNYDHQNNISSYYKSIQGYFYEDFVDSQLKSYWPIVTDDAKVYDDTFYMGCKRSPYDKYKKQFEFLVPLWLEKIDRNIKLKLEIYAGLTLVGSKYINIYNEIGSGRFNEYIGNYLKYIGIIGKGDDKLMYVDLSNKYSSIHGLDVNSGNISTKDVSLLINNLLHRERPLMEFDYLLINEFVKNKIIAKQLFNFNICFNIEDILPSIIYTKLIDKPIKFKVYTEVDGKVLNIKDFYTNYDYIKRDIFNPINIEYIVDPDNQQDDAYDNRPEDNVLNYLKDNQYIDFMDKNKIPQKICHWSIKGFPEYIFNLYNGFGGKMSDDEICDHYYGLGNDLQNSTKFVPWLNTYKLNEINYFDYIIRENDNLLNMHSKIDNKPMLFNHFIYNPIKDNIGIYSSLIVIDSTIWDTFKKYAFSNGGIKIDDDIYVFCKNNTLLITSNEYEKLSFKNIRKLLDGSDNHHLLILKDFMDGLVKPNPVFIYKSLNINNTEGPAKSITEIQYGKNNDSYNYVYRYDGYIKPSFTGENLIYFKDIFNEDNKSKYKKYLPYNYPPLYPSIGFYCFNKKSLKYDSYDFNGKEYKWFNESNWYYLKPYIHLNDVYVDNNVEEIIKKYFNNIYDKHTIDYIISQYDIKYELINLELGENYEQKYKFDIKLNLK